MLAKQNNIIIPGLGGVFWTKIFSCCFYGFYWIIKTCCVNPHILNGFSSLGLSSVAILSACTSVKSMNFYGTKNNVWGKCGQQSKLCVRQQLCVLAASPELFMLGGKVWALPSSINLSCASPGVFGVWCLPPPGGVWGAVPGHSPRGALGREAEGWRCKSSSLTSCTLPLVGICFHFLHLSCSDLHFLRGRGSGPLAQVCPLRISFDLSSNEGLEHLQKPPLVFAPQ